MPETSRSLRLAASSIFSDEARLQWESLCIDPAMNWPAFAEEARRSRLAPLAYWAIKSSSGCTVPESILADLKLAYLSTAAANAQISEWIGRIDTVLEAGDIPVLFLKGGSLLGRVYENIALRPMADIDILVPISDRERTMLQLADLGYGTTRPAQFPDPTGQIWNETLLIRDGSSAPPLEVHWNLLAIPYYAKYLEFHSLWENSHALASINHGRTLALVDELIYICAHSEFHHQHGQSLAFVDLGLLLARHGDAGIGQELLASARQRRLALAVYRGLTLAATEWSNHEAVKIVATGSGSSPSPTEHLLSNLQRSEKGKLLSTFLTLPGIGLRARYLVRQIFPDMAYLRWRYSLPSDAGKMMAFIARLKSVLRGILGR